MNIITSMDDEGLFAPHFRDRESWLAWRSFLKSMFGLQMDADELAIYQACTGRQEAPTAASSEAWLVVGRRGGKSRILALIATYLAGFVDWQPYLAPGELGYVTITAADRRQGRSILGYARGLLSSTGMLQELVDVNNEETIRLKNRIVIEISTNSFRTIRGRTIIAALNDEIAFWQSEETSNPDAEVLAAQRPAMATVPGAVMLNASSPYGRRGVLYEAYRRHYGKPTGPLVWKAPSKVMNPGLPQSLIDDAYEADPAVAASEYGAEFRADLEAFVSREVVDGVTIRERQSLPYVSGLRYFGFVDPSGGSSDSMTLAIAHREDGRSILDCVVERRPPFSPESVVAEFAATLREYHLAAVRGDRYAGEWPRERFRDHGVEYMTSAKSKSEIYVALLPMLNSGRCELLDLPRLANQLCSLERRTARSGKDSIDHPPAGHDDLINAAAGALVEANHVDQSVVCGPIILAGSGQSYFETFGQMPHTPHLQ